MVGEFVGEERRGRKGAPSCNVQREGLVGWVWLVRSRFVRVIVGFPTKWFPVGDTMSIIQVLVLEYKHSHCGGGSGSFFCLGSAAALS